jgi:hypothetical protein
MGKYFGVCRLTRHRVAIADGMQVYVDALYVDHMGGVLIRVAFIILRSRK